MKTSIISAVTALCALGLTGFLSAVSGAVPSGFPPRPTAAEPSPRALPACSSIAWPYAAAACVRAPAALAARPVRVIAVDAMSLGFARR